MDRLRLLPREPESNWMNQDLRDDLVAWLEPRRTWLIENYATNG